MPRISVLGFVLDPEVTMYSRTAATALLLLALPAAASSQIVRDPTTTRVFTAVPMGAPPTSLRASPSTTSIYLRWSCPEGASGFDVYATPAGGGQAKLTPAPIPAQCVLDVQGIQGIQKTLPGMPAPTSTSPTHSLGYTHGGVVPGASWTYSVVALYPNGAQGASTPVAARADLLPGPTVGAVATAGRNAVLTWGAMSGATGYQVHRKLAGQAGFQYLSFEGKNATSYSDPKILPPGTHQYIVQAVNGLPSSAVTVTLPPLPAPGGLRAQDFGSYVNLTWESVPGVTGYLVFRQLQGEPGFSQITPAPVAAPLPGYFTTPDFKDQPPRGQRSTYYVKAVDSDASAPVSIVPGTPRWSQIRMYPGSTTLDLNWGGTYLATSERVLRAGSPAGPFIDVPGTQYYNGEARVPGNAVGAVYYFKLQAVYAGGGTESVVIQLKVASEPKGQTCYGTVSDKGAVTWNYTSC